MEIRAGRGGQTEILSMARHHEIIVPAVAAGDHLNTFTMQTDELSQQAF